MADEVAGIRVAGVAVTVDSARTSVEGTVVVDDDLVYGEDAQCSCYPTGTRYALVGSFKAVNGSAPMIHTRTYDEGGQILTL